MWLIPIAIVALLVFTGRDRAPVPRVGYQRGWVDPYEPYGHHAWRGPRFAPYVLPSPPPPLVVLADLAASGCEIPPFVVMCAIADAEARGREDVASQIVAVFVEPVVRRREAQVMAWRFREHFLSAGRRGGSSRPVDLPLPPEEMLVPDRSLETELVPAELAVDDDGVSTSHLATQPVTLLVGRDVPAASIEDVSPIEGVDPTSWDAFCARLSREDPAFQSSRHVGQFRQRRERLAEIGIDPDRIVGSAEAQRHALDVDLADACQHLRDGGDLDKHLGRPIVIPGVEDAQRVTLSGLLGLVQVAGVENAVSWLENRGDRKRYPNTTAAFLRANGVF